MYLHELFEHELTRLHQVMISVRPENPLFSWAKDRIEVIHDHMMKTLLVDIPEEDGIKGPRDIPGG